MTVLPKANKDCKCLAYGNILSRVKFDLVKKTPLDTA